MGFLSAPWFLTRAHFRTKLYVINLNNSFGVAFLGDTGEWINVLWFAGGSLSPN